MFLDSGASHTYVNDRQLIHSAAPASMLIESSKKGATMEATLKGILINTPDISAYYVPEIGPNLLSLAQLLLCDYVVSFKNMTITKNGRLFSNVHLSAATNMFSVHLPRTVTRAHLRPTAAPAHPPQSCRKTRPAAHRISYAGSNKAMLWHCRLNHCNTPLLRVINTKLHLGIPAAHFKAMPFCQACALSKTVKLPTWKPNLSRRGPAVATSSTPPSVRYEPLECFSMDLFGPVLPISPEGHAYGAVSVDKITGQIMFFPLKQKSNALMALKNLRELHVLPHGRRLRCLKTDCAPEFKFSTFNTCCRNHAILRLFATPGEHTDNARAEAAIRYVVTTARALLTCMGAPSKRWVEACEAAVHVHALLPRATRPSPLAMAHGFQPSIRHLRTFWSPVFVYQRPNERFKSHRFKPVTLPGRFCGYTPSATQLKVIVNGRLYHRRTVIFNEDTSLVLKGHTETIQEISPDVQQLEQEAPAAPLVPQQDAKTAPNITTDHPSNVLDWADPLQDAEISLAQPNPDAPTPATRLQA
ncbi:MAG: GAG-pre-integrase domain-containing protein, partial [Flavobacteriales bacterium]